MNMKSKLFILIFLFLLAGVGEVSAQEPEILEHMSDSFTMDSAPTSDLSGQYYKYIVNEDMDFGGLINISEWESDEASSKVRVLLLNENNYDLFRSTNGRGSYNVIFQMDIVEDNGTVFWNAAYNLNMGGVACFVYWHMEPTSRNAGHVDVYLEMWDCEYYQPPITTTITSIVTNTTTTTTTTTTTSGTTTTTTDRIENTLLIYLLLGVLGGIGVIVVYMVIRPRKVKYVWDVK